MPAEPDPAGALGPLDDILGLHIRLAHGAVQRHYARAGAELGLSQKQVSVLWLVGDRPGIAQADLARALQMDRATTMALVHALERQGLVARTRSAADARRVAFAPTPAGTAALDRARGVIAAHEAWLAGRFDAAERRTLVDLLRRIHG